MVTTVDGFYKIVHLGATLLVSGFILYIWRKYLAVSPDKNEKTSNSLLFFAAALLLWEYNLFDSDYQYEVYSTIIVNGLLLVGITYFNDGVLLIRSSSPYRAVKSVPLISIALILVSHFTIMYFKGTSHSWIGYLPAILYTLYTLVLLAYRLLVYFYRRKFLKLGLAACFFLIGLFFSLFIPVFIDQKKDPNAFGWTKAIYLICSIGIYMIMTALVFSFINDLQSRQLSRIYTHGEDEKSDEPQNQQTEISAKKQIQEYIARDKIEEIIEYLVVYFKNDQVNLQTVLLLANQLTSLNTSRLRGLVNNDEYQINRSSIVERIMTLTKGAFRA